MKRIALFLLTSMLCFGSAFAKGEKQTVVFNVDLHCQGCVNKIEKNIPFEKGVKDLQCNMASKTVVVTFDADKTSVAALQEAFKKLGKQATVNEKATKAMTGKQVDAQSGATEK